MYCVLKYLLVLPYSTKDMLLSYSSLLDRCPVKSCCPALTQEDVP